jgi:hypothetical protein
VGVIDVYTHLAAVMPQVKMIIKKLK